ncbi:MAG: ABC-type transport system involved in cytochrome c biogenesis permease subunit [Candidatus Azotimanducaceae bacterium]|jgi:ABC-type transport system involved in cytochrome c biogenesis permease subunit
MWQIINYFWQICLLRVGPEKIPPSLNLLTFSFGLYFLVSSTSIIISRPELNFFSGSVTIFIGAGVAALMVFSLLGFKRTSGRFIPTISAIFGTNAMILLPMITTSFIMEQIETGTIRLLVDALAWILLIWWLTIVGSILSRAANVSLLQGFMLAFLIEIVSLLITLSLFPISQQ